jgi:hypothetical protein
MSEMSSLLSDSGGGKNPFVNESIGYILELFPIFTVLIHINYSTNNFKLIA